MSEIKCIDKEGNVNYFIYRYKVDNINNQSVWNFFITPKGQNYNDCFLFAATEINKDIMKVTMMNQNNQIIYKAKGIPERMIEELSKITNKKIISSTNNPNIKILLGEFRTPLATKVWRRLVKKDKAIYDSGNDIFIFK